MMLVERTGFGRAVLEAVEADEADRGTSPPAAGRAQADRPPDRDRGRAGP